MAGKIDATTGHFKKCPVASILPAMEFDIENRAKKILN